MRTGISVNEINPGEENGKVLDLEKRKNGLLRLVIEKKDQDGHDRAALYADRLSRLAGITALLGSESKPHQPLHQACQFLNGLRPLD